MTEENQTDMNINIQIFCFFVLRSLSDRGGGKKENNGKENKRKGKEKD